ncbi:endonuclease domain-containing protein [Wenzhouxiangella sp. XN201]|uniref:endonuclease domain-containing protein n=1 Tax=Wenzhouxiangella sp. XN201 TaxID=2710755 RepID=UPI0013C8A4ED|nr:endonuclease domain-containing protein [Wenzhouxiangella sp. XN201]NEZ03375.1 endonuclease domain-containing protein [Wenzhouxiangella sp. XN201]
MPKTEPAGRVGKWRREDSRVFRFVDRHLDPVSGTIRLDYELDGIALVERFSLPVEGQAAACEAALAPALDLLHWIAGVSYWKAGCPDRIEFAGRRPEAWQADWLTRVYREGLAEFAWHNGLDPFAWPLFQPGPDEPNAPAAVPCPLPERTLLPMGGGKDSLVALERLRALGDLPVTVQVGQAALIGQVAEAAGSRHLMIRRSVDPVLAELNHCGAFNGHVPITAINAAVLTVFALVAGFKRIVFANERSADEATLIEQSGRAVNHQFSKSLAFETLFGDWLERCITPDLAVFSLLRRDRELAVCREFAGLERYHRVFSSCNRNFHLDGPRTDRWCGHCPKCHFVFLALAPFMSPHALADIFGRNLLDDETQLDGFRALLALDGAKPFECVGEADEARAALAELAVDPQWKSCCVVARLAPELDALNIPSVEQLCRPGHDHRIPDALRADD